MTFDKKWETQIYSAKNQINKYPFDSVVSLVNSLFINLDKKNSKALDLGCGTGNNSKFLIDYGFKTVIAIDGSSTAIKIAKNFVKNKNCKFFLSDFNKFKIKTNDYDLILDRCSLTHNSKKKIKIMLRKIYLAQKNNGIFISYLFNKDHSEYKNKNKFVKKMKTNKSMIASFFDKKELITLFKKFKIIRLYNTTQYEFNSKYKSSLWTIVAMRK